MTKTQEVASEKVALWRVGKWGNGSTPDGMAIIFCDAWETAIALDAIPERTARLIVDAHNDALLARDTAARKECAEIARVQALKSGNTARHTGRLKLRREPYSHEYGQEIATAIEATIGARNG